MAEITLVAEPGRESGSSASRRLRAAGRIPAVVYGHGVDAVSVSVDGRELRHALSGASGTNQLLDLRVGSDHHLALARVLQRHPVRHTVTHVDFQIVRRDEVISADVPIIIVGEAKSVAREGGLIEQPLTTLNVNATPSRIPVSLEVDITDLRVGDGIRVGDLTLPSGVTTDVADDEIIVAASVSRVEGDVAEADAEAEAAAGGEEGVAGETGGEAAADGEGSQAVAAEGEGELLGRSVRPDREGRPARKGTPADLLAVGLGNPGREFEGSRHNAGADAIAVLAQRHGGSLKRSKELALSAEVRVGQQRLALAFPQTYMNESGRSVLPLVRRYGIEDLDRLVIVHDELDLPLGTVKVKAGGGLAGHNGLRSIKAHLHSDAFGRVRIGIGKPPGGKDNGAEHVLRGVTKKVREELDVSIQIAADAVECILEEGLSAAQNRFNVKGD